MYCLGKFSLSTAEICKPLQKLISTKSEKTWYSIYEKLYERTKSSIKKDTFMAFYSEKEQPYPETDALGVGLGASLLQVRDIMQVPKDEASDSTALWPVAFTSKSLTSTETLYSNIKREAPSIHHGPERFHFHTNKASVVIDHKPVMAIFKKDFMGLSHRLQRINIRHPPIQCKNTVQTRNTSIHSNFSYPDTDTK